MAKKHIILKIQEEMKFWNEDFEFHFNSDEYYFLASRFTEKNLRIFCEKMKELNCYYFNITNHGKKVKLSFPV